MTIINIRYGEDGISVEEIPHEANAITIIFPMTPTTDPPPMIEPAPPQVRVLVHKPNVRQGPTTSSAIVDTLPLHKVENVYREVQRSGDHWVRISPLEDDPAWIAVVYNGTRYSEIL